MKPQTLLIAFGLLVSPVLGKSQCDEIPKSDVLNGGWIDETVSLKKIVLYPYLRESDIMWSKRIWRTIDLRERFNHTLYYPEFPMTDRLALWHIIKYAALCEGMTIYKVMITGDDFQFPVNTYEEKYKIMYKTDTVTVWDPNTGLPMMDENGNYLYDVVSYGVEAYDIIEYHIKEDVFFDKERSVMETRIVGIAPVVYSYTQEGEIRGKKELFWVYFPELRYYMQNEAVYNPLNDAMDMSYDDLFQKRMYSSYIYKESNVYDRKILQYKTGADALLEADRIKNELFTVEHDLWHF